MRGPLMRRLELSIGKTWTEEPASQPKSRWKVKREFVDAPAESYN